MSNCPKKPCPADGFTFTIAPEPPNPNCKCGVPLYIVIPPGQHIHPCPIHPDRVVYGSAVYTL